MFKGCIKVSGILCVRLGGEHVQRLHNLTSDVLFVRLNSV